MMVRQHNLSSPAWCIAMLSTMWAAVALSGCVRRTLTVQTEPQGAVVFLNDEEVGPTPVSTDFTWYGDYSVIIRKEGFETVNTNLVLKAPWYQFVPIDFFFDVLWPGHIHDERSAQFTLTPWSPPDASDVVKRAMELRERSAPPAEGS